MKKIICEMCEKTEFVKIGGVYKCKSCGMEYSLDDAKRLFVEVDDNVEGIPALSTESPNNDIDMEFLKFKSEVIMRYNLFAKCHELNSNLPYKDDYFKDCLLWERTISFKNAKEKLFQEVEKNQEKARASIFKEKNKIVEKDEEMYQLYKAFTTKKPSSFKTKLAIGIILIIISIGLLISGICITCTTSEAGAAICSSIYSIVTFIITCIFLTKVIGSYREEKRKYEYAQSMLKKRSNSHLVNSMYKISNSYSYVDWYFDEFKNQPNIVNYMRTLDLQKESIENYGLEEKNKIEAYFIELEASTNLASKKIQELLEKINQDSVIPQKYRNEKAVCGLLNIIINKRASSLKEAINIYEVEQYQMSVLNTLQSINHNLGQIHKEFVEINNTLKVGFSVIGQQNAIIMDELDAIRITNSAMMVDNLLD